MAQELSGTDLFRMFCKMIDNGGEPTEWVVSPKTFIEVMTKSADMLPAPVPRLYGIPITFDYRMKDGEILLR